MAEKKDKELTSNKAAKKAVKKVVVKKATTKKVTVKKETTKKASTKKVAAKKVKDTSLLVHYLVPLHEKISEVEAKELFDYHNITIKELPKIIKNDPAIRHLDAKENDIIKITRISPTAGKTLFYRGVINE